MSHVDAIQQHYDVLLRCTTINYYVIDCLRAKKVLDIVQEAELRGKRNSVTQRILLFQWLKEFSSQKYESFLTVMDETEQEHVANLLRGSTDEVHLPLSDDRHDRLEKIRPKMAHMIRCDGEVIAELRRSNAISRTDANEIRAEKDEYVKSSKLTSAIMRRSNHSYDSFQKVLRTTMQTAVAEFLNEGEMIAVHVNNNRSDLDVILSLTFNEAIRNDSEGGKDIKELVNEMNGFGLSPLKAIPGQSIVIFIYCKTVYSAMKFTQLFNSGLLQHLLDGILSRLLLTIEPHNTKDLDSLVSLEDEEIATLEEFTGMEGWKTQRINSLKVLVQRFGLDATTQTDEDLLEKKITGLVQNFPTFPPLVRSRDATYPCITDSISASASYVERRMENKSDPVLVQTIRRNAAKENEKLIRGFTILGKELFIASEMSSEIEVYESMKFSFSRRWNLKELIDPQDIASCNRYKCLYINDSKVTGQSKEILKVDPDGKLIMKWLTGDDWGYSLSVTNESNIILTVCNKSKLNEYTSDGQWIREIILPPETNICYPFHAIKLTNGHFVVSYCGYCDLNGVCIVDADGKIRKSFNSNRGTSVGQITRPVYMAIDRRGFVFVADQGNSRVLLLDSALKFKKEILSVEKHGLREPEIILLDGINGRLFVADNWNEGDILIFECKQFK